MSQNRKIAAFGSSYRAFVGAAEGCDLFYWVRFELLCPTANPARIAANAA